MPSRCSGTDLAQHGHDVVTVDEVQDLQPVAGMFHRAGRAEGRGQRLVLQAVGSHEALGRELGQDATEAMARDEDLIDVIGQIGGVTQGLVDGVQMRQDVEIPAIDPVLTRDGGGLESELAGSLVGATEGQGHRRAMIHVLERHLQRRADVDGR